MKQRAVSGWRSLLDLGPAEPVRFRAARRGAEYQGAYEEAEPLVSIVTATYNRADLLIERCLASSLRQTYRNIEIIVVGDGCTDDTERRMAEIADPRVRFVNLERRETYPVDPEQRWRIAGANAINTAFSMARGNFISQLDDDDEHAEDRLERLVPFLQETRADFVYHPFSWELATGEWVEQPAIKPWLARITNSATIYHRWFLRHPADHRSILRWREPGDWNRFRKFLYLGARMVRHPDNMTLHYREHGQRKP